MSLLGKFKDLKDLIIVDESASKSNAPAPEVATAAQSTSPSAVNVGASTPFSASQANSPLDVSDLEKQIDAQIQRNPTFTPFATFSRMTENMKAKVPDEAQRYQAVQAATETTLDSLLSAVNSHTGVLAAEAENFEKTFVAGAEAEIQSLTDQEKALGDQIASLSSQLSALSAQRDDLANQVSSRSAGLAKAKIDFETVRANLSRRYQVAAKKLADYLGS